MYLCLNKEEKNLWTFVHLFHLLSLQVLKCGDATIFSRCVVLCLGLSWVWCHLSVWWCSKLSFYPHAWTVVSRIHVNLVGKEWPWVITCFVSLSFLKLAVCRFGDPPFWLRQINQFPVFLCHLDFCRLLFLSRGSFSFTSIFNSWFCFFLVLLNWCFLWSSVVMQGCKQLLDNFHRKRFS